ncbi:hypothetical protein K435DRAFT_700498, partial [Dendrothele bispora CBS 962.96]
IFDLFKILSLLQYHQSCGSHLAVPQTLDQAYCFDAEMAKVNDEIQKHGQPEINHQCEKCVRTVVEKDGKVPHCKGPLCSTQDSFCTEHQAMKSICHVTGCNKPLRTMSSFTCASADHQATEARYWDEEKAAFQLKI